VLPIIQGISGLLGIFSQIANHVDKAQPEAEKFADVFANLQQSNQAQSDELAAQLKQLFTSNDSLDNDSLEGMLSEFVELAQLFNQIEDATLRDQIKQELVEFIQQNPLLKNFLQDLLAQNSNTLNSTSTQSTTLLDTASSQLSSLPQSFAQFSKNPEVQQLLSQVVDKKSFAEKTTAELTTTAQINPSDDLNLVASAEDLLQTKLNLSPENNSLTNIHNQQLITNLAEVKRVLGDDNNLKIQLADEMPELTALIKQELLSGQGGQQQPIQLLQSIQQAYQQAAPATATGMNKVPLIGLSASLQDPQWVNQFADKIQWLSKQDMQSARIQLNPPELGPIMARISVQDNQANLHLVAQHPLVREALENNMLQLREMFSASNLQLQDVLVSDQQQQQQQQNQFAASSDNMPEHAFDSSGDELPSITLPQQNRLVDFYA
jgi:flagellar hook-length control protein FliK